MFRLNKKKMMMIVMVPWSAIIFPAAVYGKELIHAVSHLLGGGCV